MSKVIPVTRIQKNVAELTNVEDFLIITNRGEARSVVLPYFENNDSAIFDYLEKRNSFSLKKEPSEMLLQASRVFGVSRQDAEPDNISPNATLRHY